MQEMLPKVCILFCFGFFFLWFMLYLLKQTLHQDEKKCNTRAKNVKFTYWLWEAFMGNSFENPKITTEM